MINPRLPRLLLLITAVMLTGGCGQTGPLYMPDQPEEAQEPDSHPQPDT
jgi:predicted small lipoprotein YifL